MKEGFSNNNLINKIKKGAIIGSVAAASFFPVEKVSARENPLDFKKNKIESIKTKIENTTVQTARFEDFNPVSEKKLVKIKDEKIKAYIMDNYSIDEIYQENYPKNESKILRVDNPQEFIKEILETAEELGYSKDKIKNLSIHDAIMLGGNILAQRVSYHYDMIDIDSTKNVEEKVIDIFTNALEGTDTRNEEARRIDQLSVDKIFFEGKAICRNYATVNKAIFEVLKKINDNLKNTYMKWYSPGSLSEVLALPHAWNQIINLSEEEGKLKLLITYVDPTWLDTRKTTADASGNKTEISSEEIYNAFDANHFFEGCISAHVEIAKLYELLGNNRRTYIFDERFGSKKSLFNKEEVVDSYLELAYNERIKICKVALDSAQNNSLEKKKEALFNDFQISFLEALSNIQEQGIGHSTILGATIYDYGVYDYRYENSRFTKDKLEEFKNLLLEGTKVFSEYSDREIVMKLIEGEELKEKKIPFFEVSKILDKFTCRE